MRNVEHIGEGLIGKSFEAHLHRDIFEFEMAKALLQQADIGIARMLFETLVTPL